MIRRLRDNWSELAQLPTLLVMLGSTALCPEILAVTITPIKTIPYTKDLDTLSPSLKLPADSEKVPIRMSTKVLNYRNTKSVMDKRVEALTLRIPVTAKELAIFTQKVATQGQSGNLFDLLSQTIRQDKTVAADDGTKRVTLSPTITKLMEIDIVREQSQREHHKVTVNGAELRHDPEMLSELNRQIADYFSVSERRELAAKIKRGLKVDLDESLLPTFARRMVGRFTPFRGPNCFHAALAFQDEALPRSRFTNVKKEDGYHAAMINYDELWRVIQNNFYEINPDNAPLKYGDLLVYFDVPKDRENEVYFRWIRHAATYLFGPYTFSKGSKSPDTPYTVKTLGEEWQTWKSFSKNLGLKVYRRATKDARTLPPNELIDWMY